MRAADIYCQNRLAGRLTENPGGEYVFRYDDEYMKDPFTPAVSLTLPKTRKEYRQHGLFPFFANMLSEGHNRKVQAAMHKLDKDDDFGILLATAQIDTPGAVTVKPIDDESL